MSQPGETNGYSVSAHVDAISRQVDFSLDYVIVSNEPAPENIIKEYMKEELQEQFARIRIHADEAIDTLGKGNDYEPEKLMELIKTINKISQDTSKMADTSKVQVMYNPEVDNLNNIPVIEEKMLASSSIVDHGVQKRVIRHDPEKLASAIIKLLWKCLS